MPYRGAQAVYQDIFGGRLDLYFDNSSTARPFVDAKRVKPIVVSAKKRQWLYVGAGILAATFSLVIGLAFVFGEDAVLPDLDPYLQWIGGPR